MAAAPSQSWEPVGSQCDLGELQLGANGTIEVGDGKFRQDEAVRVHGTPWAVTKPGGLGSVLRVVREDGAVSAYRFMDGVWYQLHWWLHLGRKCRFAGLQLLTNGQVKLTGALRAEAGGIYPSIQRQQRNGGAGDHPGERVRVATGHGETAVFAFLGGTWFELSGFLDRSHVQQVKARFAGHTRLQLALACALVAAVIWFAVQNLRLLP